MKDTIAVLATLTAPPEPTALVDTKARLSQGHVVHLQKKFRFEAAHKLPHYVGKCANLHGHTYHLEVRVSGLVKSLDDSGILIDFGKINDIVKGSIVDVYDHKYLNDYFDVPSAEHMVAFFFEKLTHVFKAAFDGKVRLECLRLNEGGGDSWAEVHNFR